MFKSFKPLPIFIILIIASVTLHSFIKNVTKVGPLTKNTTVIIEKGMALNSIAQKLMNEGFIDNKNLFLITTKLMDKEDKIQAGEIKIPAYASVIEIIELLSSAKSVQYKVTIPEGLTTYQIVQLIENESHLSGKITLKPLEGNLLPETYYYSKNSPRNRLIERMQSAMETNLSQLWEKRSADLPYDNQEEALIMASIIEKETSVPSEYDLIAGVLVNRLNKGKRLQTDPTIIYALSEGKGSLGRALLRKDLSIDHPYNTYKNYGLPPGPICNPGIRALKASLNPAQTDYLYFVADGTGGHAFAQTLAEHNRNVAQWRQISRQKRLLAKRKALAEKAVPKPSADDHNLEEDEITLDLEEIPNETEGITEETTEEIIEETILETINEDLQEKAASSEEVQPKLE